jgi:hypothetical protein
MLQVFLGWSGPRSECLARYVNSSLSTILPGVQPFYSPAINPGAIWPNAVATAIRKSRVAILCITRENLSSPWLQFEAGAFWQRLVGASAVCPLLLDVSDKELPGTFQLFQTRHFNKRGFRELCEFLGRKARIYPTRVRKNFKAVWPGLEADVQACLSALETQPTA